MAPSLAKITGFTILGLSVLALSAHLLEGLPLLRIFGVYLLVQIGTGALRDAAKMIQEEQCEGS